MSRKPESRVRTPAMPVRVLVVDDHPLVRIGTRAVLEACPELEIVGEVTNGEQVVSQVQLLRPDVLILDLTVQVPSRLEIIHQLTIKMPQTRIVVLSRYANEAYVIDALRNGAAGYVLKRSEAREVVHAIHAVMAGNRHLSPELPERRLEEHVTKADVGFWDPYETLGRREREVLHLVAAGYTSSEAAARLCVSERTVESHRARIMRKLGLRTHTDLVRYALRRGILRIDE